MAEPILKCRLQPLTQACQPLLSQAWPLAYFPLLPQGPVGSDLPTCPWRCCPSPSAEPAVEPWREGAF